MVAATEDSPQKIVIGNTTSGAGFWLFDDKHGFDLTRPSTPSSPTIPTAIALQTKQIPILIDPAKTALVIIDMQNFFLSPGLGRSETSLGLQAQKRLIEKAVPAARKAKIRVVWLNWGLNQREIDEMPPSTIRAFGFKSLRMSQKDDSRKAEVLPGTEPQPMEKVANPYKGLGGDLGTVQVDGKQIAAGRKLMRNQWNSDLTPELQVLYEEGQHCDPPDALVLKNRPSGFWDRETPATQFLNSHGISTLLFAGVNTDQCVGGSIQDASYKGYDVVLLSDCAATTSPDHAQKGIEFNCTNFWGFCMDSEQFSDGVDKARK